MQSSIFPLVEVSFSNSSEMILPGGRKLFPLVTKALEGVESIGFIGWGSQGPAQAQNFRDTLRSIGSSITVRVGLREHSPSRAKAREAGFHEEDGTLGDILEIVQASDFLILLIADGAMVREYKGIFQNLKPGATIGFSHGFLRGFLDTIGESFPDGHDIILMAPKGMGPSVRRLYLQGATDVGAGINSSIAVEQDVSGHAWDRALAWAVATGSPVTFETTMIQEVRSDLYGERGILLGALWAIATVTYEIFTSRGTNPKEAFQNSANALVGVISQSISERGLLGTYTALDSELQKISKNGYEIGYAGGKPVLESIYTSVSNGSEIRDVIEKTRLQEQEPMISIEQDSMWQIGNSLYKTPTSMNRESVFTLGLYMGVMMAQIDTLREHGHHMSEIVNESLIEAIDSLNPYMWARGVAYMVDNCSITARLGTRKWGPVFMDFLRTSINSRVKDTHFSDFLDHPIHADILTCFRFRPSVKISVE